MKFSGLCVLAISTMLVARVAMCDPIPPAAELYRQGSAAYDRRDYQVAIRLWQRAAYAGSIAAMERLAAAYGLGKGVPEDDTISLNWHKLAAEAGDESAMVTLGLLYRTHPDLPHGDTLSVYWLGQAAGRGSGPAMFALGGFNREGKGLPQDCAMARRWYEESVAAGDSDAKEYLTGDVLCQIGRAHV